MLEHLVESGPRPRRSARGMAVSVVVHVAVIAAAVVGTASGEPQPAVRADTTMIHFAPPAPRERAPSPAPAAPAPRPRRRDPAPASPIPTPPVELPTGLPAIPPVPMEAGPTLEALVDALSRGAPEGPSDAGPARGDGASAGGPADGAPFDAALVERAVVPHPRNAAPRYPASMRGIGVQGEVLVRFVVDTAGRVEEGSVEILSASAPAFAEAVRAALGRHRFRPAEAGGRRVRQLVEQRFAFRLD